MQDSPYRIKQCFEQRVIILTSDMQQVIVKLATKDLETSILNEGRKTLCISDLGQKAHNKDLDSSISPALPTPPQTYLQLGNEHQPMSNPSS